MKIASFHNLAKLMPLFVFALVLLWSSAESQTTQIPLKVSDWNYYSWQSGQTESSYPPSEGVFEETVDGLRFWDNGLRGGSRIETKQEYSLASTTLKVKWRVNGGGGWGYFNVNFEDLTGFNALNWLSTSHSYSGSTVIQSNTWYYTRVVTDEALQFTSVTALNNYDNLGGSVIQTRSGVCENTGTDRAKIQIAFEDTYASTVYTDVAEVTLSQANIVSAESNLTLLDTENPAIRQLAAFAGDVELDSNGDPFINPETQEPYLVYDKLIGRNKNGVFFSEKAMDRFLAYDRLQVGLLYPWEGKSAWTKADFSHNPTEPMFFMNDGRYQSFAVNDDAWSFVMGGQLPWLGGRSTSNDSYTHLRWTSSNAAAVSSFKSGLNDPAGKVGVYKRFEFPTALNYTPEGSQDYDNDRSKVDSAANKLVIVIHGWNRKRYTDFYTQGEWPALVKNLSKEIKGNAAYSPGWDLYAYRWGRDSYTGNLDGNGGGPDAVILDPANAHGAGGVGITLENGTQAAEIGYQHGLVLGKLIAERGVSLEKVHFIAHSAGTWVARSASLYLHEHYGSDLEQQITLLDPYNPNEGWKEYGSKSNIDNSVLDTDKIEDGWVGVDKVNPTRAENIYSDDEKVVGTNEEYTGFTKLKVGESTYGLGDYVVVDTDGTFWNGHSGPITYYAYTVDPLDSSTATGKDRHDRHGYVDTAGWEHSLFMREYKQWLDAHPSTGVDIEIVVDTGFSVSTAPFINPQDEGDGPVFAPASEPEWSKVLVDVDSNAWVRLMLVPTGGGAAVLAGPVRLAVNGTFSITLHDGRVLSGSFNTSVTPPVVTLALDGSPLGQPSSAAQGSVAQRGFDVNVNASGNVVISAVLADGTAAMTVAKDATNTGWTGSGVGTVDANGNIVVSGANGLQVTGQVLEDGSLDTLVVAPQVPEIHVVGAAGAGLVTGMSTADCGSVPMGQSARTVGFTIHNTGTVDLADLSVSVEGTHAAEFAVSGPGVSSLAADASALVQVTFTPAGSGSRSAMLRIFSNDADENPFDIALSGVGYESTPVEVAEAMAGTLAAGEDAYFRVTMTEPGVLIAWTEGGTDTHGAILAGDGEQLGEDADSGPQANFRASADVLAGDFFIRVAGGDAAVAGAYTLRTRFIPATEPMQVSHFEKDGPDVMLGFTNTKGALHIIEHSTDMQNWLPVLTLTGEGAEMLVPMNGMAYAETGFFRVGLVANGFNPDVAEGIDQPEAVVDVDGDAAWFTQTSVSHDGTDAARSGLIYENQSSGFSMQVTGPINVSFWWKVSSAVGDKLRFLIDGVEQPGAISGEVDWQQVTHSIGSGSHTLTWSYAKDGSGTAGTDCGWVDQVVQLPPTPEIVVTGPTGTALSDAGTGVDFGNAYLNANLVKTFTILNSGNASLKDISISKSGSNATDFTIGALSAFSLLPGESTTFTVTFSPAELSNRTATIHIASNDADENPFDIALVGIGLDSNIARGIDFPDASITNGGQAAWFTQASTTHDGMDAAQSGLISHSQNSAFSFMATGPATVSFWWKVSSESGYDYLRFYIDGVEQSGKISGSVDWQQKNFTLGAGNHSLQWAYSKDGSVNSGADCGWVDEVEFIYPADIVVEHPAGTDLADGATVSFGPIPSNSDHQRTFTIRNTGGMNLTGLSINRTGDNPYEFQYTQPLATTLSPGESTTFTATFSPWSFGSPAATLQISSNDPDENPFVLMLTGSATAEEDFGYKITDGEVAITGYSGPGGEVVIPEEIHGLPVTSITGFDGYYFPIDVNAVTSITIPAGVTEIGSGVFSWSVELESITVDPSNPAYSSLDGILYDKPLMTLILCPVGKTGEVVIPVSVTTISGLAFSDCYGITVVTIPAGVEAIASSAFQYCRALKAINVDSSNANYSSLNGILYDKAMTILIQCPGGMAGSVTIPAGVTDIAAHAFGACIEVTGIMMPYSLLHIGSYAFGNCYGLTDVTIPSGVTSIGDFAFHACDNLTGITLPEGLTSIANGTFSFCSSLDSIVIPESVTSIGIYAFRFCSALTSVSIPASVTSIGDGAFAGCISLPEIAVDPANANYVSQHGVLFNQMMTHLIQCPAGKIGSYTVPSGVTTIGRNAFGWCESLTSVVIPATVTSIGDNAFLKCDSLAAVVFLGNAPSANSSIFQQLPADFRSLHLPGSTGFTTPTWQYYPSKQIANAQEIVILGLAGEMTNGLGSVDFGNVYPGSQRQHSFTILNTGMLELSVLSVSIEGDATASFSAGTPGKSTLATGESTSFIVEFVPTVVALLNATLRISSNDADESPFDVQLIGNGLDPSLNVAAAIDVSARPVTHGGQADWFWQPDVSHDGIDAAQSGYVSENQKSSFSITATGPGTVSFRWKVSSDGWDFLRFYIDGVEQGPGISGELDWQQVSYPLAEGVHTLEWSYEKHEFSFNQRADCGWVDEVSLPPGNALESWRLASFGTTANTGGAADLADMDQDGVCNLLEYAFGLNPLQNSAHLMPAWQRDGDELTCMFDTPAGVSGVFYGADWSPTMEPESWLPVADTGVAPQHIFSVPVDGNEKKFVRVKVSVP